MELAKLTALVAHGESRHLEFKKSTTQLRAALETACAFLNGNGGVVLLGVSDNGQLIGQDVTDQTQQEIAREINKIEPTAQVEINYLVLETKKQIITLEISAGQHRPYVYDGRPYERNQSTTMRMSQHRYEQLLMERGQLNYSWEKIATSRYNADMLDHQEIVNTISQGIKIARIPESATSENIEELLSRFKLIENGALTNAAVALFAKDVRPHYPQCMLKLARFKGTNHLYGFIDNQRIYGNIFKLLSEADIFLMRHLPVEGIFQQHNFQRQDRPALPMLAVREALINALCHRDYTAGSSAVSIAIFDDRMEIWNAGNFPERLKIENIRNLKRSIPRNELIAEVLYVRGYVETWGTGISKMFDLCEEHKVPPPEFMHDNGGLLVVFKFKDQIGYTEIIRTRPMLNSRQEIILNYLRTSNGVSVNQLLEFLNDSVSMRTIRFDLTLLKKMGLVEQIGKARHTVWKLAEEAA